MEAAADGKGWGNLLAGVDERGLSDDAVHAAARMARTLDTGLELAHGVQVPPVLWLGIDRDELAQMHAATVEAARVELGAHLAECERRFELRPGELTANLRVYPESSGRLLADRARELGAAVVFLGRHRRQGVLDFGNTARAVLHQVPCGVWVQPGPFAPVRTILVPIDHSEKSFAALDSARGLAARLDARVEVAYVYAPPEAVYGQGVASTVGWPKASVEAMRDRARSELEKAADAHGIERRHLLEGRPAEEILRLSADHDLVVMGTQGRTGLAGFLLGSVAYEVLRNARRPVLALRNPWREGLV